jgi:hypothetical protein
MGDPSIAGFLTFVRGVMGVPSSALPDDAPALTYAFNVAVATTYALLAGVPTPIASAWTIYEIAVYNLGGDLLINYAPDLPGQTPADYWAKLREKFGTYAFTAGVVSASYDQGTGETMTPPDFVKSLTLSDLQRLKTPYGRRYLEIAQSSGPLWGLS